jgi:NTP pyrophosphatase (non-canonical NTP hydrolase)
MKTEPKIPHLASAALKSVMEEMAAQDKKWGADRDEHDLAFWHLILSEEVGEWAEAILHYRADGPKKYGLRSEIVQVAAVALQIIEDIDRSDYMETINDY